MPKDETKPICPIMGTDNNEVDWIHCQEGKCALWAEAAGCCVYALPARQVPVQRPPGPHPNEIRVYPDGDKWCAVWAEGFTNIQECDAGFGNNPAIAVSDLSDEQEWEICEGCGIGLPLDRLDGPHGEDSLYFCARCKAELEAESCSACGRPSDLCDCGAGG